MLAGAWSCKSPRNSLSGAKTIYDIESLRRLKIAEGKAKALLAG